MTNRGRRRVLAAATAAGSFVLWRRWRPFRVAVRGESMEPVLRPDDWVIAVRPGPIRRGVIVVFEHPERPGFELIKRVTAVPGDSLGALTLGADRYWVVGERPQASTDSRWFGPISRAAIRGVAVLRYWPRRRIGWIRSGR